MANNKATTDKAKVVKQYEHNCPQKLRGYVEVTLGHKFTKDWDYDAVADEWGYGYMLHWNEELEKLMVLK